MGGRVGHSSLLSGLIPGSAFRDNTWIWLVDRIQVDVHARHLFYLPTAGFLFLVLFIFVFSILVALIKEL